MIQFIRPAVAITVLFTLLTGLLYPLAITGIAQLVLPGNANGSPIVRNGTIIGSALIGQAFVDPKYFWSRPSAAGNGYDAANSSGSNLGPTSRKLMDRIAATIPSLEIPMPIPADAATASASGLDPDISPAYARAQVSRVAAARSLPAERVATLLERSIESPMLWVLGEAHVNVLKLNLALDALSP